MKKEIQILSTFDLTKEQQERFRKASDRVKLTVIPTSDPDAISDEIWAETDVLYTWDVLPGSEKVPHLKWVQFGGAGVDFFMQSSLAQKEDILLTSMSGAITSQLAEYVVMALLALGHKMPELMHIQADHHWLTEKEMTARVMPVELRGSTVGILGYGSIGRQVARLLQPFGAEILAAKRDVMHPEDSGYIPEGMGDPNGDFFTRLYPMEALHSMIAICDFVVVTLPLTDETHHLLGQDAFEAMKETAYLVNVGRGAVIDEKAMIAALQAGKFAGAALDVFEVEPLPEDNPLWDLENVFLSSHVSWLSKNIQDETLALFLENLNRYLAGLPLYNQVDLKKGY
ncbi:MAG: D-2-hydroxyacid dehydrogenase [Anaerolineaceae bacterium]|nr:D-2-hydroxyacid dehydrogenase [Anaerolineaceae bacterium]